MDKNFLKNIENVTGVKADNILQVAKSFQQADFKDEKTVRNLIHQISKMANKPVTKKMEDQLTKAILSKNIPNLNELKKKL
ncbi:hypothetical protein HNQ94_002281 [Salirhabdus euzebyi]|uniref:Stage VI sporulation protein F n=1 Tax=Salirhabdus euzebyi TaxID=394506 RepID=A0A841Q5Z2_9BACI|nr:stage VI sporulation protein F [Salirhabdus euzebyi]MBB6453830.1 hypothetical protein [Salirhabdus euzebyi]